MLGGALLGGALLAGGGGGGGANPGNNLHVSGLSSRVDNRMLEEAFGKYGKVSANLSHLLSRF